jgi:transposase
MQFVENLSDQQAADSVRGRLDWKYLLGLELTDAGFDASVLSEFRTRLIDKNAEELLLAKMLTLFGQKGWLKARGRQRTDSTHVLADLTRFWRGPKRGSWVLEVHLLLQCIPCPWSSA